jgi:glycogen synthase
MRLLLTTDPIGGVWDYTATLAAALTGEGQRVLLAVVGSPSDEQISQLPEDIALDCAEGRLEWMTGSAPDLARTATWLAGLSRRWDADVVHLNQMAYSGLADFAAPTAVVVHSDVHSWFREVAAAAPGAEWRPYSEAVVRGLRAANARVAPSRYQADSTARQLGIQIEHVIHNGAAAPPGSAERREAPLLLTAGRAWDRAKGIDTLDAALALLGAEAPPAHLLGSLAAPDGTRSEFPHLRCHGRVSAAEMDAWMRRASLYVAPSLYEPFGLAPLEAALRGCALLLSDIGSFRELWSDAALFFRKGDARSLAAAIAQLAADRESVESLAARAEARARSRFSIERFAGDYLQLYHDLLDHRRRGRRPTPIPVR